MSLSVVARNQEHTASGAGYLNSEAMMNGLGKRSYGLFWAMVIALSLPTAAVAAMTSKADYTAAKEQAEADYKVARAKCDAMSGNAKDVCVAEAQATEKKAKAEAEAAYKNTNKARRDARIETAEADYAVAKARCGAKAGHDKDVCVQEAKAAETKAKAGATASAKVTEARKDAAQERRDADYKVAVEKCDALSGAAKDECITQAKAKYGK